MSSKQSSAPAYPERLRVIDAKLATHLAERVEACDGAAIVPADADLAGWQRPDGPDAQTLGRMFGAIARLQAPEVYEPPQELRTVIGIMRRTTAGGLQFLLTHVEQYRNASVVHLQIDVADRADVELHRGGMLDLGPGYRVRHYGGGGHPRSQRFSFLVTPPLPDDLDGVTATLRLEDGLLYRREPVPLGVEAVRFPGRRPARP